MVPRQLVDNGTLLAYLSRLTGPIGLLHLSKGRPLPAGKPGYSQTKKKFMFRNKQIALYQTRIERGIKWLNKNKPGWLKKINLKKLDLEDDDRCILGQAFKDFWLKVADEGDLLEKGQINFERAISLGFALEKINAWDSEADEASTVDYDLLTAMWFTRLTDLRRGCK